jgi:predicted transcriptional regulator
VASITINISDQQFQRVQQLAHKLGLSPEEWVRISIDDWLSHPKSEFSQASSYVLKKNTELYQRLA